MSELLIRPEVFRDQIADFGFEYLSFETRRLNAGEQWSGDTAARELAIVVLGGVCSVTSSRGEWK
ncbi:MAG: 5-deoxy-glucuronate isomerase, partial [Terracidiphilus sp.]